jgi:hypothetical protein
VVGTLPSDGLPVHVREITDQLLAEFNSIGRRVVTVTTALADTDRRVGSV